MQYFKPKWVFMKIFRTLQRFFHRRETLEGSQKNCFSFWNRAFHWVIIWFAGALAAAAFPPLNFTAAIFFALAILFLEARNRSAMQAALAGWVWGTGYALCSFFWLREIHPSIPWMLMFVLGAYYIPVGWCAAIANRYILLPAQVRKAGFTAQVTCRDFPLWRQFVWSLVMASAVVLVEYLRSNVLPWNYLGTAFYRNAVMMQLVRYTGIFGLSFLAALFNAAIALALLTVAQRDAEHSRIRYRRPWPLLSVMVLLALLMAMGVTSLLNRRREYNGFSHKVRLTIVQGNLPALRNVGEKRAYQALNTYTDLTRTQKGVVADLVIWPETAVPYPLRGNAAICALYRAQVRSLALEMNSPMLLGTLEFDMSQNPPGSLNSAVLTDARDVLREGYKGIYSKVHPVPFGEFVPMRKYLPQWVINLIDMQRDLTPGKSLDPIKLNDNVRIGVSICFEDVFAYIARAEFMRNANLLLVIADDSWYPASSEPEQHLANSMARAIETNLPMVRCGNDSASCLITPGGEIIWSMAEHLKFGDGKPFRRGGGAATITVNVPSPEQCKMTFYSRYGNWFVYVCAVIFCAAMLWALLQRVEFFRREE